MKLLHQAFQQRFVGRAPHQLNRHRTQRAERLFQRRGVDQDGFGPWTRRPALAHNTSPNGR
jgi:hypothetical protein